MPEIKFTDEELQEIQSIQVGYQGVSAAFGELKMQELLMATKRTELEKSYVVMKQKEETLVTTLNTKYGDGELDPNTGIFTPNDAILAPNKK